MPEINKFEDVLNQYNTNIENKSIVNEVNTLLQKKFNENNNIETLKLLYSCIDLTSLNTTDSKEDIWKLTEQVNNFEGQYSDISNVAAICVYPNFAETVKEALTAQNVKIACVSGGFPSSQTFTEVKIAETALAIANGADEIDIVLNLGLYLEENYQELCEEIQEIKHACREAKLKVILETGALKTPKEIMETAILSLYSGADFLKTSTGKTYEGATLSSAYIICTTIKEYYKKTGIKVGFKAAGGIKTSDEAISYYTIVKEILGNEWCNNELFRLGASSLANNILEKIK